MKKKLSFQFLFFISLAIFQSCDKNRVFEKNFTVEKSIWNSTDKLNFDVDVQDTAATYNVYINVRHASIYPYSNLWLMVTTTTPDGKSQKQRVEVSLAAKALAWQ